MRYEIRGGAGPYEAAAIAAVLAYITIEQLAAAAEPPPPPQQSAWVTALWAEGELVDDGLALPSRSLQ
jgi:hypothetical protein